MQRVSAKNLPFDFWRVDVIKRLIKMIKKFWIILFVLLTVYFVIHIHKDITSIQVRLNMLDECGKILPEYNND